jgi:hypothetical protein
MFTSGALNSLNFGYDSQQALEAPRWLVRSIP